MMTIDQMRNQVIVGDALAVLKTMPAASVNTVITSPPYYGLRDYDNDRQLGLENTYLDYVANLTSVFSEVYRVLRDDGTLWVNLGDTYARGTSGRKDKKTGKVSTGTDRDEPATGLHSYHGRTRGRRASGKSKELLGIPWRVAFALSDAGWVLRSEIIWSKPSSMPESVRDRPTRSHETVFLFSKARFYYFNYDLFREPKVSTRKNTPVNGGIGVIQHPNSGRRGIEAEDDGMRNRRTVWEVATVPTKHKHSATFPPALIVPMLLAGCPAGGVVLDPFMGSGTTGMVAKEYGADFVGIELNPEYAALARCRIAQTLPGLPLLGALEVAS